MTVSQDYQPHSYNPGASMAPQAIPFKFLDPAHVVVTHVDGITGVTAILVNGTDYTITGDGDAVAASITATAVWPVADLFHLTRATGLRQEADLLSHESLPSKEVERELDRRALIEQEQRSIIDDTKNRSILVPEGETAPDFSTLAGLIAGDILQYNDGKIGRADFLSSASKFVAFDSLGHLVGVDGALPNSVPALASNIIADGGGTVQEEIDARPNFVTLALATAAALFGADGGITVQAALNDRYTKAEASAITDIKAVVQGQARINWASSSTVSLEVPENIVMAGMLISRNYRKGFGKSFSTGINGTVIISFNDDLAHEATKSLNTWYEFFAVANDGDANCDFKAVPYLAVKSVAGNVVTLGESGEGKDPNLPATFTWPVDALAGAEVLLIEEGFAKSRRFVNCTANTTTTITLDDVGALAQGDRILVMPNGWDHYASLCPHYLDSAEPRNIADLVVQTWSHMSFNISALPASGAVSTPLEISMRGFVPPLANGAIIAMDLTISTTSSGDFAHYLWHDSSSHEFSKEYEAKLGTANWPLSDNQVVVPFSGRQSFYYSTAGSLAAQAVSRSAQVRGWIM